MEAAKSNNIIVPEKMTLSSEIRGVYVYVEPVIGKRWKLSFCDFNVPTEESDWMENEINKGNGYKVYVTYEEALEAGIQEALKLI